MGEVATCHPGKPHRAHGLCRTCYTRAARAGQLPAIRRPVIALTELELAYLAGIIDGEGSLTLGGSGYVSPVIQVGNTNAALMTWLSDRLPGRIKVKQKAKPHHKQAYDFVVNARAAYVLLPMLLPYLVIKRSQADVLMKLQPMQFRRGKAAEGRVALKAQLRILNRRGMAAEEAV